MTINFSNKEFRRLLDLVYIGNWVLNSNRGDDRFSDYDDLESKLFGECRNFGLDKLCETEDGINYPSVAYCEGGIHEAIMAYEDSAFFEILAEEMANKDMNHVPITEENFDEFADLMCDYIAEFEKNGTDNLLLDK